MAERTWKELVAEGRRLMEEEADLKWHWVDLVAEVEPLDVPGKGTGGHDRLRKWAEEIGWFGAERAFETLLNYRQIARAWPADRRRQGASFTAHAELRSHPERFTVIKDGMSAGQARKAAGTRPRELAEVRAETVREALQDPKVAQVLLADPQVRHVMDEARPSEDRAEQARRLIRDPAVAQHVVRDDKARSNMARAAKDMEEEATERQRERAPGLVGMSDFYQAAGELSRARQSLSKALDAMRRVDLSDDERESLQEDAKRAGLVLDWIGSYLKSGDHSFDKELDALLQEEL
jgi:hypothetical protein